MLHVLSCFVEKLHDSTSVIFCLVLLFAYLVSGNIVFISKRERDVIAHPAVCRL